MDFKPQPKPNFQKTKKNKKDRSEFPPEVREQIVEHYGGYCGRCGRRGEHIHHIKSKGSGGRGVYTNGILLCAGCHTKIHMDGDMMKYYKDKFEKLHGPNYYMDEIDKESRGLDV